MKKNGVLKMPRIDENGNAEFHPVELPPGYQPAKMRDDNSFIREVQPMKQSRRTCKTCGTPFTLLGEYDPGNPAHDLCDDCLLKLPQNPDQRYPEKTAQIAGMDTGGIS
jgi:hypothetical protein